MRFRLIPISGFKPIRDNFLTYPDFAGRTPLQRYVLCFVDVALNVLPFAVTEAGVALCSEVDGINTIAPEDIGTPRSQP